MVCKLKLLSPFNCLLALSILGNVHPSVFALSTFEFAVPGIHDSDGIDLVEEWRKAQSPSHSLRVGLEEEPSPLEIPTGLQYSLGMVSYFSDACNCSWDQQTSMVSKHVVLSPCRLVHGPWTGLKL